MARYSRRFFPGGDELLEVAGTTLLESTISRFWDDGEILVLATVRVQNASPAGRTPTIQVRRDGLLLHNAQTRITIPPSSFATFTIALLNAETAGVHTYEIHGLGDTDPTQQVIAESSYLTVIQLPQWDSPDDIA